MDLPYSEFGPVHCLLQENQDEDVKCEQQMACSDYKDVQTGLGINWCRGWSILNMKENFTLWIVGLVVLFLYTAHSYIKKLLHRGCAFAFNVFQVFCIVTFIGCIV